MSKEEECYSVIPLGNAWAVKRRTAKRFTAIAGTKKGAIAYAKALCLKRHLVLYVHKRNGMVESKKQY